MNGIEWWGVGHDTEIKAVEWKLVNETKITKKRIIFVKVIHFGTF
jgi:hypothetical protein